MRFVRLYLGVVFSVAGVSQWFGLEPWGKAADWPATFDAYVKVFGLHPVGWSHAFLVAHPGGVAVVAATLHVLLGVAFLVGKKPRLTAGIALALLVSYLVLTGFSPIDPNPIAALAALALAVCVGTALPLRLYIGIAFLYETVGRIRSWPGWLAEVQGFLSAYMPAAFPWQRPLMSFALHHVSVFAWLVALGEATVATSLLLEIATPVGVGIGVFLSLNYLLSKGNTPWSFNNDFAFIVSMPAIALTPGSSWRALARAWRSRRWSEVASRTPLSPVSPGISGPSSSSASPPPASPSDSGSASPRAP